MAAAEPAPSAADLVAAIGAAHRLALARPVGGEVGRRHPAAGVRDGGGEPRGDGSFIEAARAVAADGLERAGKVWLAQDVAARERRPVRLQEDRRRARPSLQPRRAGDEGVGQVLLDGDARARQGDGGRDEVGEREAARAIA